LNVNGGSSFGNRADNNKIESQPGADIDDIVNLVILFQVVEIEERFQVFAIKNGMVGFLLRVLIRALVTLVPSPDASIFAVPKLKTDSLYSLALTIPA